MTKVIPYSLKIPTFGKKKTMSNNSKSMVALLIGVAVGAVLGILLAPQSGAETRKKASDTARKAAGKVKDNLRSTVNGNNPFSEEEAGV